MKHAAETCPVCVEWARSNVLMLSNIDELEKLWLDREPDDHIYADATEEQRAFWEASFYRTSEVIRHIVATRLDGEDAETWHARVLRAASADDSVAMHNVDWVEYELDRRARKLSLEDARRAYPKHLRGGMTTYDDGIEPVGSGENASRNALLIAWLHAHGLEWAQGTRFAENLEGELKLHPPDFMRKRRRHRATGRDAEPRRGWRERDDGSRYAGLSTAWPHDEESCAACTDLADMNAKVFARSRNGDRYEDWRASEERSYHLRREYPNRTRALIGHWSLVNRSRRAYKQLADTLNTS